MKKISLAILMITAMGVTMYGQPDVMQREYGYDAAGNRIIRKVVIIPPPPAPQSSPSHKSMSGIDSVQNDVLTDRAGDIALKIYPNPTTSAITLEVEHATEEITGMIYLHNSSGGMLSSQAIHSDRTEIDMRSYPAGIYLATVLINGKQTHWKNIKQ
jgi:hypothetical protein